MIALTLKSKELERLLAEKRSVISSLTRGRGQGQGQGEGDCSKSSSSTSSMGGRSHRDHQKDFALKRAEDFADALLANRRSAQSQVQSQVQPPQAPAQQYQSHQQYQYQSLGTGASMGAIGAMSSSLGFV